LRHRQFSVLVTTSAIARQGYKEVREDRHPIIFIAGKDITQILIQNGYNSPENVQRAGAPEHWTQVGLVKGNSAGGYRCSHHIIEI
jgi:hypothetical protein